MPSKHQTYWPKDELHAMYRMKTLDDLEEEAMRLGRAVACEPSELINGQRYNVQRIARTKKRYLFDKDFVFVGAETNTRGEYAEELKPC